MESGQCIHAMRLATNIVQSIHAMRLATNIVIEWIPKQYERLIQQIRVHGLLASHLKWS